MDVSNKNSIALIGSYVPRKCGIATFTKDVRDAISNGDNNYNTFVVAIDDKRDGYQYPKEVRFQIQANELNSYKIAAQMLNINKIDLTILQHEFGIYGGPEGKNIIELIQNLGMPLVTIFHTILKNPNKDQRFVMNEIIKVSDKLVVMSNLASEYLINYYNTPAQKIHKIHHGIPDIPFSDTYFYKEQFGLDKNRVMLTFGLLSPGKGIENIIKALPEIIKDFPDLVFVVLGAIHPYVYKREGNEYLNTLSLLANRLGVSKNIMFHTRYVSFEELCSFIEASDIYVSPYLNEDQIVSGTLAYATGMGKAVISTPYLYAKELLDEGRGIIVPFNSPEGITNAVKKFLNDTNYMHSTRKKAYLYGRNMIWKEVGKAYVELTKKILSERHSKPKPIFSHHTRKYQPEIVPEINMSHLLRLTDDTGIIQHAIYSIPNRLHGYCLDDNARALITCLRYYELVKDEKIFDPVYKYLSFIQHAFDPEKKQFKNFLSYDKKWVSNNSKEDAQGRAFAAIGLSVLLSPNDAILSFATNMFQQAIEKSLILISPRAWASTLIGIHYFLERFNGDSLAKRIGSELTEKLYNLFKNNSSDDWPWCEDIVTYANAKLPHALILSGQWMSNAEIIEQGLISLNWLVKEQTMKDGTISIIGNSDWYRKGKEKSKFDQQPLEVMCIIEACYDAYIYTRNEEWKKHIYNYFEWFLGNNETKSKLYNAATGGCRDGLHSSGRNINEGAESTISWLRSLLAIHKLNLPDIHNSEE